MHKTFDTTYQAFIKSTQNARKEVSRMQVRHPNAETWISCKNDVVSIDWRVPASATAHQTMSRQATLQAINAPVVQCATQLHWDFKKLLRKIEPFDWLVIFSPDTHDTYKESTTWWWHPPGTQPNSMTGIYVSFSPALRIDHLFETCVEARTRADAEFTKICRAAIQLAHRRSSMDVTA